MYVVRVSYGFFIFIISRFDFCFEFIGEEVEVWRDRGLFYVIEFELLIKRLLIIGLGVVSSDVYRGSVNEWRKGGFC